MKIIEIQIYGYGKLENLVINNLSQLQVFYGVNEAGKSTIMSFIHSILFGFPTKQQSELRYEPKIHAKYGGKLILQHSSEGTVVIERVKGKASGDVMVTLEDGTTGGETLLSQLLKNIDKSMFQSIFSFNLSGLQNIQQVKSEDLGKFLFSTGAVGTDKLLKVENELKKELEHRFKPGGKKPIINEKIKELHELELKVKEAQRKNDTYLTLTQKRISLEHSIKMIQFELKELHTKINRINEWKKHFPNVKELISLNQELVQTVSIYFPIDGLKRYESLLQLIKPLEAQLTGLLKKYEKFNAQLPLVKVNPRLLELEIEVEAAISNLPLDDQLATESLELKVQLENVEVQISQLKEKLNYAIDEQLLATVDTSIFMKEKIGQVQGVFFRLKEHKQMLDSRFQEEKTSLELLEKEIIFQEEQLLSEEERESITQQWNQAKALDLVRQELKDVQEKIEYHRSTNQADHSVSKSTGQTIFLFLFFLFLAVWSGLNKEWALLFITSTSFVVLSILFVYRMYFHRKSSEGDLLTSLIDKERNLLAKIPKENNQNSEQLLEAIQQDNMYREKLQVTKLRWTQQQLRYDHVIQAYEKWELETKRNEESLKEVFQSLSLNSQVPWNQIAEAFQIITDLKELIAQRVRFNQRLNQVKEKRSSIHTVITKLADQLLHEKKNNLAEMVFGLREALRATKHNAIEAESILLKIGELDTEIITVRNEQQYLVKELNQLLKEAGTDNEEDFRSKAKVVQRREQLVERKAALENQLKLAGYSINEYQEFEHATQLESQIAEWNQQWNQLEVLVIEQQQELAEVKHLINVLEEGGTYTELLHKYKHLKYELEEQAKIWGTYAIAKHMLTKTIERYKNEKLPTLLQKAEGYLNFLTMGSYIRIHTKKDEVSGFMIERKDATFFEGDELSQATMEQVYVSIRLALATTLFEKTKFPIIIDDSFVNFDQNRTERMLQMLSTIKEEHQILFFTCHSHLLKYFDESQIIELRKTEEMIGN